LRSVQSDTEAEKREKGEGLVSFITCVTSGGREVDVRGEGHNRKYVCAYALVNGTQRSKRQISQ